MRLTSFFIGPALRESQQEIQ